MPPDPQLRPLFPNMLLLSSFWLLLSGHYSVLLLGLGLGSTLLVLILMRRADRMHPQPRFRLTPGLLRYLAWLGKQLVLANLAVARRILDPRLPIQAGWAPLETNLQSPLQRTLLANSITLTPDTFTTHIQPDGQFMVHTLWPESLAALRSGELEARIRDSHI